MTKVVAAAGGKVECQYFTLGGQYHSVAIMAFETAAHAWADYLIAEGMSVWSSDVIELIDKTDLDVAAGHAREIASKMTGDK
jgi:hypothetical protein